MERLQRVPQIPPVKMKSKEVIEQKYKNVTCPKCSSNKIKKDGKRKTENRGKIQRYRCKDCNFRFVIDEGFYRMRNHPNKITAGIDLYYKGVSLRKVQEHFQAFYTKNSSHVSVYNWILRYATMVSKLTDNIPIECGQEMMSDEITFLMQGENSDGILSTNDIKDILAYSENLLNFGEEDPDGDGIVLSFDENSEILTYDPEPFIYNPPTA